MLLYKKIGKGCFAKNSLYFFAVFMPFLMLGCKNPPVKTLTNQEWYIDQIHYGKNSQVPNVSYYVVRFYANNNFSLFSGTGFAFGQWRYVENQSFIQLHPNFGDLKIPDLYWKIEQQIDNKLTFGLYQNYRDETEKDITLECTGLNNISAKDPFLVTEHAWRKRPFSLETDEQIKTRVLSYLHFLETMYQHTFDNKLAALRYDWFPQPMRMEFSNAIRMAYSGDEMVLWNKCFYDSAQAVKAYLLIGNTMIKQELKASDNMAERNLDFVKEMEGKLK
jgi:hypothetical protein